MWLLPPPIFSNKWEEFVLFVIEPGKWFGLIHNRKRKKKSRTTNRDC